MSDRFDVVRDRLPKSGFVRFRFESPRADDVAWRSLHFFAASYLAAPVILTYDAVDGPTLIATEEDFRVESSERDE